jgi:hypothetical protein
MTEIKPLHDALAVLSSSGKKSRILGNQPSPSTLRFIEQHPPQGRITPVTNAKELLRLGKIDNLPPGEQLKHLVATMEYLAKCLPTLNEESLKQFLNELPLEYRESVENFIAALSKKISMTYAGRFYK